jgi:hypothetical protein
LDDSLNGVSEVEFEVVYMYRYPNKYFDYSINKDILLGDLKPRYPLKATDNFTFSLVSEDINMITTQPSFNEFIYLPSHEGVRVTNIPLSTLQVDGAKEIVYDATEEYVLYCHNINVDVQTLDILISAGIPEANARKVCTEGKGVLIKDGDRDYLTLEILPKLQGIELTTEILTQAVGGTRLAYLDECYNRYYLKWIDRKGGIQC